MDGSALVADTVLACSSAVNTDAGAYRTIASQLSD
jgi:hypothetical protein